MGLGTARVPKSLHDSEILGLGKRFLARKIRRRGSSCKIRVPIMIKAVAFVSIRGEIAGEEYIVFVQLIDCRGRGGKVG